MRTTLTIDEDVLAAARDLARHEGKTIGEVLSALARRGLRPRPIVVEKAGFPVFQVSEEASPITLETVHAALDG